MFSRVLGTMNAVKWSSGAPRDYAVLCQARYGYRTGTEHVEIPCSKAWGHRHQAHWYFFHISIEVCTLFHFFSNLHSLHPGELNTMDSAPQAAALKHAEHHSIIRAACTHMCARIHTHAPCKADSLSSSHRT